jgi:hypothetical protein
MADKKTTKTTDKQAKKLIAEAEESVVAAQDAVRKARKKLQKKAQQLEKETKKLTAQREAALDKSTRSKDKKKKDKKKAKDAKDATPTQVKKSKPTDLSQAAAESIFSLPLPHETAPVPTLIELRQRARARGIVGYSRMSKATLLEKLGDN